MRLTYAPDVDAIAIWLASGAKTVGARQIALDTYADFERGGRLLGIEVLNAGAYYAQSELDQLPAPDPQVPE